MSRPLRVGITHGDINGISYELIIKCFDNEAMREICTPVLFGSSKLMGYYKKVLERPDFQYLQVSEPTDAKEGHLNLVNITGEELKIDMGKPTAESGAAALLSLEKACEALEKGEIDVLVTCPINKHAMQSDAFHFPGHTEYLESRLGGEGDKSLMILYAGDLRVALVTTHLPLKDVAENITTEKVEGTIRALDQALRRDFRKERPVIAVLSLNPHAGDMGTLGSEEQEVIAPAIESCVADGIMAFGPFAADGFFGSGAYRKYDGVVAMYHDQGLAPFKALATNSGVNFTAGLPYVRTSPDHGTAYDLVGKNLADPGSLREAIYSAIDIYRHRRDYEYAKRNPLRKQYVERGQDKTVDLTKEEPTD